MNPQSSEIKTNNKPPHHTESGFQNQPFVPTAAAKGAAFYLRRFWHSIILPEIPENHVVPSDEALRSFNSSSENSILWLGHASFLIRLNKLTILTDPYLSEFASPLSWAGPRRFVAPAIPLHSLPAIDIILVSHNHYDHLDDKTVSTLNNKHNIQVFVPLGLKSFFEERGYRHINELDWHQNVIQHDLKIHAVPSVHDSARSTSDHNQTLWASWLIEHDNFKILFIGDSGYSKELYQAIGQRYGEIDYLIVPIGAYEPRELMWMSHVTPKEAVNVGKDVKAKTLIASHWGTINLSDEPLLEPPVRFQAAGKAANYSSDTQWILKIGETRRLRTENN